MTTSLCYVLKRGFANVTPRLAAQFQLRAYQEQCLDACLDSLASGSTRIGVSLPTGSGKTTVFLSLLSRLPEANSSVTKSLIIVNGVELARQSAEHALRLFPEWSVEIEQGPKYRASGHADLTVATYQTLLQHGRLQKFDPSLLKAVVVDEAHHAAAPSYRKILSYFHRDIDPPEVDSVRSSLKVPIIGFSATFGRHDGLALGSVFERIVYHRDFLAMIEEEWLSDVKFTSVKAQLDLTNVTLSTRTGDFNPSSLAHVVNTKTINDLVVKTWLDRAAKRKSTLVFCVNIAHVESLTQAFRSYGVDARYLSSLTPAKERAGLLSSFKEGQFPVLVNCAILTEGSDIPNIDCVIVARPTRSRNVLMQMIGRGMRLSPETGKTDCRIIDFVDSNSRVSGVVGIPTLFGLDPRELEIQDETLKSMKEKAIASQTTSGKSAIDVSQPKTVTYTDFEDPFSFVHGSSGAPHIRQASKNAWVGCGGDIYVLECLGKGFIRIEKSESCEESGPQYVAKFTPASMDQVTAKGLKISPTFRRSRQILTDSDLATAIRGCDTFASIRVLRGHMVAGLLRTAKWRQQPASDAQKAFISQRIGKSSLSVGANKSADLSQLTKGEAANIITRLKHGALKRHSDKVNTRRKEIQKEEQMVRRLRQTTVTVGPLAK